MSEIYKLENVKKLYPIKKKQLLDTIVGRKIPNVEALENLNISIETGKILAVVGESGSGKSTLGKIVATIEDPSDGKTYFEGKEINGSNLRSVRKSVSMVFQNPATSINPRMKVKDLVSEPLGRFDEEKVKEVLHSVVLDDFSLRLDEGQIVSIVGSSRTSNFGLLINALAIAILCTWPPENSLGCLSFESL